MIDTGAIKKAALRANTVGRRGVTRGVARLPAVLLVGFMGAGKTSVGAALARRLGWSFEDLDDRIERREGRTVREIFRESGEARFRRAEHEALRDVLEELREGAERVVALGGGAFVQERNAGLIAASGIPTVFLDAPVEELWRRCSRQAPEPGMERPLLTTLDDFRELYEQRRVSYIKAPLRLETGGKSVERIAAEVGRALSLAPRRSPGRRSPRKRGERN